MLLYKINFFAEPHTRSKNKIKYKLDLPNYATKSDLKNTPGVDTSDFAKKADLASLNTDTDRLDIDKLDTTPTDLSNIIKNDVVKKAVYDALVKNVNAIQTNDTSHLVKKKLTKIEQKLTKLKRKFLIMTYISTQEFNKLTTENFSE